MSPRVLSSVLGWVGSLDVIYIVSNVWVKSHSILYYIYLEYLCLPSVPISVGTSCCPSFSGYSWSRKLLANYSINTNVLLS